MLHLILIRRINRQAMAASTDCHQTKPLGTLCVGGGVQGLGSCRRGRADLWVPEGHGEVECPGWVELLGRGTMILGIGAGMPRWPLVSKSRWLVCVCVWGGG